MINASPSLPPFVTKFIHTLQSAQPMLRDNQDEIRIKSSEDVPKAFCCCLAHLFPRTRWSLVMIASRLSLDESPADPGPFTPHGLPFRTGHPTHANPVVELRELARGTNEPKKAISQELKAANAQSHRLDCDRPVFGPAWCLISAHSKAPFAELGFLAPGRWQTLAQQLTRPCSILQTYIFVRSVGLRLHGGMA